MSTKTVKINRAPVMTLWGAVVAERLGHGVGLSLTLGKAVAGLNAQAKGKSLGIFEESRDKAEKPVKPKKKSAAEVVELMGRKVRTVQTPRGKRAASRGKPMDADAVKAYLEKAFGEDLPGVREALEKLAWSMPPKRLAEEAYSLYEAFRPSVSAGKKGWGAKGQLKLESIQALARKKSA